MRKLIAGISAICLSISLMACGTNISVSSAEENNAGEVGYPLTITDQSGREVVIDAMPQKLVSSYYITTSLLIALGCADRLVAVEDNVERHPIYIQSASSISNLPSVGSPKEFDLEACVLADPDLVILPMRLRDAAANLEDLGINVMLVNPESREEMVQMIELVATATGTQDKGDELKKFIKKHEQMLDDKLKAYEDCRVYLSGNSDFLSTAGKNMYQASLINLAGGANVADEIDDNYWATTDYEQILKWNPSYIILASDAKYSVQDVLSDANLSGCEAIEKRQVYQIPSEYEAWDSPVPSGILGALWLANILHPEEIDAKTVDETIKEYYETFYGF